IDQFMSFGKSSALRRFPCRSSRCAWVQELDTEKSGDQVCFMFMPAPYDDYKDDPINASIYRRILIPKKNGEKRPLGIPTIADRAWQALIKLVLEPEGEAKFHPKSYGFRPGRSAWDATQDIFLQTRSIATRFSGKILELDIEKCFDRIDHKYLMQTVCLPKQYKMGVWRALKAGVMIGFQREDTTEGTLQGGVFSPLLANLALHGIENIGRCIRYADDMIFVIQKGENPERMRKQIDQELQKRGLKVK